MLTNTQINSYLIPEKVWNEGIPGSRQLLALCIPARDALEIERRRNNGINLRNEDHRYVVACERIQALAIQTYQNFPAHLHEPIVWPATSDGASGHPTAIAYLTTLELLYRGFSKSLAGLPYQRFLAVFFPPADKDAHLKLYEMLVKQTKTDDMMERAAKLSKRLGQEYEVTAKDCKSALLKRLDILIAAQTKNCALVDAIQIV